MHCSEEDDMEVEEEYTKLIADILHQFGEKKDNVEKEMAYRTSWYSDMNFMSGQVHLKISKAIE
jgi:hypothetical protein